MLKVEIPSGTRVYKTREPTSINALFTQRGPRGFLCFFHWNSSFIDSSSSGNFFFFFGFALFTPRGPRGLLCFPLFFPVELEFHRLEFYRIFFFFFWFCSVFLCSFLESFTVDFFFLFSWSRRQTRNWNVCMHLLRNRDRQTVNVIHKHSFRGKEAENVNTRTLHQNAFSVRTKL